MPDKVVYPDRVREAIKRAARPRTGTRLFKQTVNATYIRRLEEDCEVLAKFILERREGN